MTTPALYKLHRLLIGMSIGLGLLLLVYGIVRYARAGDGWALVTGIGGAIACGALLLYLRWFQRKQREGASPKI